MQQHPARGQQPRVHAPTLTAGRRGTGRGGRPPRTTRRAGSPVAGRRAGSASLAPHCDRRARRPPRTGGRPAGRTVRDTRAEDEEAASSGSRQQARAAGRARTPGGADPHRLHHAQQRVLALRVARRDHRGVPVHAGALDGVGHRRPDRGHRRVGADRLVRRPPPEARRRAAQADGVQPAAGDRLHDRPVRHHRGAVLLHRGRPEPGDGAQREPRRDHRRQRVQVELAVRLPRHRG